MFAQWSYELPRFNKILYTVKAKNVHEIMILSFISETSIVVSVSAYWTKRYGVGLFVFIVINVAKATQANHKPQSHMEPKPFNLEYFSVSSPFSIHTHLRKLRTCITSKKSFLEGFNYYALVACGHAKPVTNRCLFMCKVQQAVVSPSE